MGQTIKIKVPSAALHGKDGGPPSAGDMPGGMLGEAALGGSSGSIAGNGVGSGRGAGPGIGAGPGAGGFSGNKRKDTKAFKNAVLASLGVRGPEYWDIMKKFIQGKINRVELDALTGKLLTAANYAMHNKLINAILHNAFCRIPPPTDRRAKGNEALRRRRHNDPVFERRRAELKADVMAVRKEDRAEVLGLKKAKKSSKQKQQQQQQQQLQQQLQQQQQTLGAASRSNIPPSSMMEYHPGLYAPLSIESGFIPNSAYVKAKMTALTLEEGLSGISDSAARCVMLALDTHLKNVIGELIERTRRRPLHARRTAPSIDIRDMNFLAETMPAALVDHSVVRERIKARLWEFQELAIDDDDDDVSDAGSSSSSRSSSSSSSAESSGTYNEGSSSSSDETDNEDDGAAGEGSSRDEDSSSGGDNEALAQRGGGRRRAEKGQRRQPRRQPAAQPAEPQRRRAKSARMEGKDTQHKEEQQRQQQKKKKKKVKEEQVAGSAKSRIDDDDEQQRRRRTGSAGGRKGVAPTAAAATSSSQGSPRASRESLAVTTRDRKRKSGVRRSTRAAGSSAEDGEGRRESKRLTRSKAHP